MNVKGNRSRDPCNIKILSKNTTLPLSRRNDLNSSIIQNSNMPEDNLSLQKEGCDAVSEAVSLKNDFSVMNVRSYNLIDSSKEKVQGASIENIPCCSNDYVFGFCNRNITTEPNMNHKFYGYKRKDYSIQCCESFGLPDDPIFTNNLFSFDTVQKSPLDANLADPCDICVINLDYIDQPWLITDQEVITPYWDVESLFPFEIEDIRQKIEPENIDSLNNASGTKDFLSTSENNNKDTVFTSTPLKNVSDGTTGGLSVVSTINIANKNDSNVDISLLKDQVMRALEEAIRKKSSLTNLDMKIQIVADLCRSSKKSSQKSSVEVRINECADSESCQSSSSNWKEDLQDSLEITENSSVSDLLNETRNFDSASNHYASRKTRKNNRRKQCIFPTHQRNLRSRNKQKTSTEGTKKSTNNSISLITHSSKSDLNFSLIDDLNKDGINTMECVQVDSHKVQMDICKSLPSSSKSKEKFQGDFNQQLTKDNLENESTFIEIKCDDYKTIVENQNLPQNLDIEDMRVLNQQALEGKPLRKFSPTKRKNNPFGRVTRSSLHNDISVLNQNRNPIINNFSITDNTFLSSMSSDQFPDENFSHIEVSNEKQIITENSGKVNNLLPKEIVNQGVSKIVKKRVTRRSLKNVDLPCLNFFKPDFNNYPSDESKMGDKGNFLEDTGKNIFTGTSCENKDRYNKISEIIQKGPSNGNLKDSGAVDEITEDEDEHKGISFRRILRSSSQGLKKIDSEVKQEIWKTLSNSASDICTSAVNKMTTSRRRTVSADFDKTKPDEYSLPVRRCLRSQVSERNTSNKASLVKFSGNKTAESSHSRNKSSTISFNWSSPNNDYPRNVSANTQLKSILKNVSNIEINFNSMQQQKIENVPALDFNDTFSDLPKLSRQDNPEEELDNKKNDGKHLKDNGITSRVRVLISPLEIKDDDDDSVDKKCPELPLESTLQRKRTRSRTSRKTTSEYLTHYTGESKTNNNILEENVNHFEIKAIKNENIVYNVGSFVWAQVAKFPYWPAVVCNDPITEKYFDEVLIKNKVQMVYHIRFFGDSGKRAWVTKNHIMLYCSKDDLKMISKKLKSENKSYNIVKPYLVMGAQHTIEKWNKANEEIEMLKDKSPEEVVQFLIECYENFVNKRREKRKLSIIDASSESESEEAEPREKSHRKRIKLSLDQQVVADERSQGFDEINISLGTKNNIEISDICFDSKITSYEIENSRKPDGRKSAKKLKHLEISSLTPHTSFLQHCPPLDVIDTMSTDLLDVAPKVTPRRSTRSLKAPESLSISDVQPMRLEDGQGGNKIKLEKDVLLGLSALTIPIKSEASDNLSLEVNEAEIKEITEENENLSNQQSDEVSEIGSKTCSDSSSGNSHMYTFEYQIELHKKNSLFNGLRNVKVCDYCMKQGDLYKCKGKCGGSFHLECASKVTQPRNERRHRNKDKGPTKSKQRNLERCLDSTPKSKRSVDFCKTRSQSQCEIITIKSRHLINTPNKDNLPANFHELNIAEQIDYGMKELMSKFEDRTIYLDLTDSSSEEGSISNSNNRYFGIMESPASTVGREISKNKNNSKEVREEEKSSDDLEISLISERTYSNPIKHVTADSVILTDIETPMDMTNLKCTYCRLEKDPPCFSCGLEISKRGDSYRQKCSQYRCGRYYHLYCLKMWPQTQWSIGKWSKHQQPEDSFTCPAHICHTCFSEELGSTAACRLPGDKLARCLLCPAAFHSTTFCVPAGSEILGGAQIVCPRHKTRHIQPINTVWCFICSEGGNLVCCDMCPTSVHPECQPINFTDDDKYICEDCESGRFPLYDEIVWVKLGQYRWWPAIVLFPNEVPENVRALKHQRGDFAVRFFGTNDHYWVNKSRSFLFQEGDRGGSPGETNRSKNKVYEIFGKAIEDAALAYKLKKEFKLRREAETISSLKPPSYVRINKNKPVGNVKCIELNLSNATACECDPNKLHPCGSDSNCINRLLMTECDPDICRAGIRCRNQAFQKREYPPMVPYKTQGRGWGLKTLAPIKMGQFVIEYVGELIDSEEYQRRIKKMHEKKEENYYFMTVDSDRMIDAGPKGNLSRFMNHSCNPNCVTQKWTVKGDTRVGLFAKSDIDNGSELTFNYNLEVVGQEKKVCKCGAGNCSGYIGVKAKLDKPEKSPTDVGSIPPEHRRSRKKPPATPPLIPPPCFMCGRKKSNITCNNKFCNKGYHLKCLKLKEMPEASKYTCPRHNCNICSNRTIRCCVKCSNSFCPSHSEGNVRHDKFLGFVCRLHDPGISPTEGLLELVKEDSKPSGNRSRSSCKDAKKIFNKKETLDPGWQEAKKTMLMEKSGPSRELTEIENTGIVQREAEGITVICEGNVNKTDKFKKRGPKNSIDKRLNRRKISHSLASLSVEKREALRAQWRMQAKKYRLKKKMELLKKHENLQNQDILPNNISSRHNKAHMGQTHNVNEENLVKMSETNNDAFDVVEVTPSSVTEKSAFDSFKATTKGRIKLDTNDEAAVSSTTSEECNNYKRPDSKKKQQLEFDSTFNSGRSDEVTSSPTKYIGETSLDTSEDELSLSTRLNRLSNVRKFRKKNRFAVNKLLLSTAKPS